MTANDPGQPHHAEIEPTRNLDVPASALAIGAHPDDAEFGCGGTLAKWAAAGCEVHHLICTDGSKGTWDRSADLEALIRRRQSEQHEASRRLRGSAPGSVHFLGVTDGELDCGLDLRSQVARVIREVRPEVVLGHDPWKRYRIHPDHRYAGWLTCDAVVAARDPHFFPEHGLEHHRPSMLLLFEADVVHHVEDVTDHVDTKLSALEAHVSQFESTMHASDEAELEAFRTRVRNRLSGLGQPYGYAAAEVFAAISRL